MHQPLTTQKKLDHFGRDTCLYCNATELQEFRLVQTTYAICRDRECYKCNRAWREVYHPVRIEEKL